MFIFKTSMLMDDDLRPVYRCPVCGNIGLVREHDPISDNAPEYCRCCGGFVLGQSNLDTNAWMRVWHDHGAKHLWEMPFEERCDYQRILVEEYSKKHIYIPSEADIRDLDFEERAFTQNFFKTISDPAKKIVVETSGKKIEFPYVTNTIYKLDGDRIFLAVGEKYNSKFLFLSDEFQYNINVYRTAYVGLLPDIFKLSMPLDETCEVEDNDGKEYVIYVE